MPEPEDKAKPDYISTVYTNLKQAYGDKFSKTEDEFRDKVNTDYGYRKTVHTNLKQAYGGDFKKDFNTFNFNLPAIQSPATKQDGTGLQETSIEDYDRASEQLPQAAKENKGNEYGYPRSKVNSAMPSETTQNIGGQYRDIKAKNDEVIGWGEKQKELTSQEQLAKTDPDVLKSDIGVNSQLAGKLFAKQGIGPDAIAYSKYLMHLKNSNPTKYEEKVQKISKYGLELNDQERYNEINDGLNGYASLLDNDKEILKARGGEMRLKEATKLNGKLNQLTREFQSYESPEAIPEDKKLALKAKYDTIKQQKDDFESDPKNKEALDKYDKLFSGYDEVIKGQNKLIMNTPSVLRQKQELNKIHLNEAGMEAGVPTPGGENYQIKEAAGNVWNTVVDNAVGLVELAKDAIDHTSGYSVADKMVDSIKSTTDAVVKATISDTDMFDAKGNIRWYRFGPNLAKVGTDMAIMLAPVGRLKNLGEAMKLGKYADEAAIVSSQFATTYDDYKKDGLAHGMSSQDSEVYGAAAGFVTSLCGALSPNEAILNPGTIKGTLNQLAERYAKQGITGLTKKEGFTKLVSEMTELLGTTTREAAKESGQENAESIAEKTINIGFNANRRRDPMSKKLDENITREEFLSNTIFASALAGAGTLGAQAGHQQQINDGTTFELIKNKENYSDSQRILNDMHENGKLSEDAYNRVSGQLESAKKIYDKIPEEWSDTTKQNLIPIIREKVGLEDRIKRLDKSLSLRDNKRLDEIDKTLAAFNEKESGIETSNATEGGEKNPSAKTEDQAPEDHTQYEPLNDTEIEGLKTGSPVSLMEDGKKVDAKVSQIFPNGEVMLDIGSKKKIVLDSSLIKEKELPKMEAELNLNDEELKTLHEENAPEIKKQQESSSTPGSEGWNLAVKNRLEKVFKGSEVSFNQEEFDAAAKASEHDNAASATGFYDPKTNKIFLNPSKVKKDTQIHEFGHIWTDVLKEKNPEAYNKALQLAKQSDFYKAAESNPNYAHLSSDALAEEAFVSALGKKGVDVFSDIADKNAFHQFMTDMWDHIKDALGLSKFKIDGNTSFTELVNKAAEDLGKNKTVELKPKEGEIKKQQFNEPVANESAREEKKVQDDNAEKPAEKFKFDPESEVGKKVKDFVKTNLDAGKKEDDIKSYLKSKTKLSDDVIDEIVKSAKKPVEEEPEIKTSAKKTQPTPKVETGKTAPEKPKVKQEVKINDKIIDISRTPVNSRINTVLSRVFNNPETPQTLKDTLANRFGSKEQMLKSNRYSQQEARGFGKAIVNAFVNLNDAIEFATNKGYQIDGDIQAAILDNVISDAYNAEKKAKTDEDREYYKGIQRKGLDEIAAAGEQSGRRIAYYNMMYNVNPVIFGEKMADAISNIQAKVIDKKLGDSAQNADEKINQFAKESENVVNREKKNASDSGKVNEAINNYQGPKYKGPKTTKTSAEVSAIRKSRSAMMDAIKKKLGGTTKGPDEKFAFDNETEKLDEERLTSIKQIGDTFIDEGYLNYNQWARKVQNEFKEAGIDVYGKELKEVWGRSNEKVQGSIKETYKSLPEEELNNLIHSQAAEKIKEQSQAIKDVLADTEVSQDMKDKIKNRLINELGLSEGYSKNITDSFMSEFETHARAQVEIKLRQIKNRSLISSFNKPNKSSEQKIVTDILNGTFDGEKLKPSFYEAYGMTPAKTDQGLKDRLTELSRKAVTQKEGSLMKDKAMRDLYNEISKHKPSSIFALGTDVYYSSLLSGYETHIKNFVLYNALQVYINKPLQMAMQNMLSGNKSKSATAVYSKELFKNMLAEAEGIVRTGSNSFYTKPHEQSELQKFTSKPGGNPLKFLWRYADAPTNFLSAEDAFGTMGLSEPKARQIMYDKIKNNLKDSGERIDPDQINEQINKALGYTEESKKAAQLAAEQSLKNYYGDDFNLQQELTKKPKDKEERKRQAVIRTEYIREAQRHIVNQRDAETTKQALDWSKEALLQNDPTGTLGGLYVVVQTLVKKWPAVRIILPFVKVPLNITNNLIHSAPVISYLRAITGKKGQFGGGVKMTKAEKTEQFQKATTYTLLTVALAALQELKDDEGKSLFYVTGKNGRNYTEALAREEAGIDQPYTVYIAGKPVLKYMYTPWMPLFTTLGIINDVKLDRKQNNNDEINYDTNLMSEVFIKYVATINDQAAMKGVNEIVDAVQGFYEASAKGETSNGQDLKEFLEKKLAQTGKQLLVPNAATQVWADIKGLAGKDKTATTSFMDDIIKDMPIVDMIAQEQGNEVKLDVLGRPIKEKAGIAGWQKMGDDPYYKLFVEKHFIPYPYNKRKIKVSLENPETGDISTQNQPLSLEDRYKANKMRGDMLYEYMKENIDDLKGMSDEEFKNNIQGVILSASNTTEKELFNAADQ